MTNRVIEKFMREYEIHYHKYGAETQIECITRRKDRLAYDEYGQLKTCVPCGGNVTYNKYDGYKCLKCGECY